MRRLKRVWGQIKGSWRESSTVVKLGIILLIAILISVVGDYFHLGIFSWAGVRDKTLWDWIGLVGTVLIPILLAIVGQQLSTQQARIADDRARETTLQNYFDKMTELLLENDLRTSTPGSEVQDIARARTVTTLRQLDKARRNILLRFLSQTGLIGGEEAHVRLLSRADLREADLSGAFLYRADLSEATLSEADLSEADLSGADLRRADLGGAILRRAELSEADLSLADLSGAILREASLMRANLRGASLIKVNLSGAKLSGAKLSLADLSGAILSKAHLTQADLREVTLPEADLHGADLSGADLGMADLSRAKLSGANLSRVDLSEAVLSEADLNKITYNNDTKWPDNFTPSPDAIKKE
jgi:uncharacterized protein YjbI with pentapeptide repeats